MNGCVCQCDEHLYSVPSRQDTDIILDRTTPVARGETRVSEGFRVDGQSVLRIMGRGTGVGAINGDMEIRVQEAQVCQGLDQTDVEPTDADYREVARFRSIEEFTGTEPTDPAIQYISTKYSPNASFVRFVEVGPVTATALTAYTMRVIAQPIGCCDPAGWAGRGSPIGPGEAIATKADLVIGAGVETGALLAADIPAGTRRVTITNVGSNPVRLKGAGEGGGAGRGAPLNQNDTISIGTRGGALDLLDAFSTLGTTLAFLFERD